MNLIDDVKDTIPEGTYLQMCNVMKNIYIKEEKNKINEEIETLTARGASLSIAYSLPMYKDRFRLKKDRVIEMCYGTENFTVIPHTLRLNNRIATFKKYCNDEHICIWTINRYFTYSDMPLEENSVVEIRHHISIKDNKKALCSVNIKYHGVKHLEYEKCNIKTIVNSIYNN